MLHLIILLHYQIPEQHRILPGKTDAGRPDIVERMPGILLLQNLPAHRQGSLVHLLHQLASLFEIDIDGGYGAPSFSDTLRMVTASTPSVLAISNAASMICSLVKHGLILLFNNCCVLSICSYRIKLSASLQRIMEQISGTHVNSIRSLEYHYIMKEAAAYGFYSVELSQLQRTY